MLRATGLESAFGEISEALAHLGFVQIDPINVSGRMHDHILRHRVRGYRENDLMQHLHPAGPRAAFEHHLPDSSNLAALPLEAWPHLQRAMRARETTESAWSGKLTPAEKKLANQILAQVECDGPLCSQDIRSVRKAKSHAWDSTTLTRSTLQKLFFHGRVLIARREGIRRYYDLPENVLPAAVLKMPVPSEVDTVRWLARMKLRQRRLAILKAAELRAITDELIPVIIPGTASRFHVLRSDLPVLEETLDSTSAASSTPRLIAPLDPIIYDRRVTQAVWDFDYRWEVYVPPHRRVRGYYALPLLYGEQFIGHADVKADRESRTLRSLSQIPARSAAARTATASLAEFLGLGLVSSSRTASPKRARQIESLQRVSSSTMLSPRDLPMRK